MSALLCLNTMTFSSLSLATTSCEKAPWDYLNGKDSFDAYTGVPKKLETISLPRDLASKVINMLPEQADVRLKPVTKQMLANDLGANIFLNAEATIKVSYVYSSTSLNNSLAFFKFKQEDLNTIKEKDIKDTIFFPNFNSTMSYPYPKPSNVPILSFGKTVTLGKFSKGDAIGFSLIQNFWDATSLYGPRPVRWVHGNILNKCKQVFRTIKRLNPEPTNSNDLSAHTLLFSDIPNGILVLGMENLHRSNDNFNDYGLWEPGFAHDFNDVVIAIQVDPISAVMPNGIPDIVTGKVPPPTPTSPTSPSTPTSTTPPPTTPTPISAEGPSGPLSWREVTSTSVVNDPVKEAKAASRKKAAK
jgi:Domain of unknown function (DUF4114)